MQKADRLSILFIFFAIFLFLTPFLIEIVFIGLLGLLFIIGSCIKWGLYGGTLASLWASGVVVMFYVLHGGSLINVGVTIIVYFLIGILLGKGMDILRDQQSELKESEARYRLLLETLQEGIWAVDAEGHTTYVNDPMAKMLGCTVEEMLGKHLFSYMDEKGVDLAKDKLQRRAQGVQEQHEFEFIRKDGERIHTILETGPVLDKKGNYNGAIAGVHDITERKRKEDRLREIFSKERQRQKEMMGLLNAFRSVVECETFEEAARRIFDGCCKATGAISGYVALMNTDGSENEVLFLEAGGMPCNVNPELPMPIRGLREEAYNSKAVVFENDFMRSKWVQFMPSGHVELFNVMFVPLIISNKVVGVIGLANKPADFTEDDARIAAPFGDIAAIALRRTRDQETLKDSEMKYRKLAESTEAILWEFNIIKNRWTYVAPQVTRILGYLPEEWTDLQFWIDHLHPEDRDWAVQYCFGCAERGEEHAFEYRFLKKNGGFAWLRDVVNVEMRNGKAVELRGFMLDITERKQAEQKLADYTAKLEHLYQQLDEELDKARQVHERTLPKYLPRVEGVSFAAHYQPAQKLGGDFYDIVQAGDKIIFYLSDVSGHGLDGAMLSVFVKHTVKHYLSFTPSDKISPSEILRFLAEHFRQESYPEDYFICIFMAVLDLKSMELTCCGAGYQDMPLVQMGNGHKLKLTTKGLFITNFFQDEMLHYKEERLLLNAGTTIFCNTDGLTEHESNGSYYMERLPRIFYENAHLSPHLIAHAVIEDFRFFNDDSLQGKDDITFLVLQVDPAMKKNYRLELASDFSELIRLRRDTWKLLTGIEEANMFMVGLNELVANAIEHGNRMISSKTVTVDLNIADGYIQATVEDQGEGFDWRKKLGRTLELDGNEERGRGIAMTSLCCDWLCYNDKGNRATILVSFC